MCNAREACNGRLHGQPVPFARSTGTGGGEFPRTLPATGFLLGSSSRGQILQQSDGLRLGYEQPTTRHSSTTHRIRSILTQGEELNYFAALVVNIFRHGGDLPCA